VVNTFHYYVGVTIWLDETAAAKPIFHSLKWYTSEYGALVEWYRQGKADGLWEKLVTVPLFPPQIKDGQHRSKWACVMKSQQLTTCVLGMAITQAVPLLPSIKHFVTPHNWHVLCNTFFHIKTQWGRGQGQGGNSTSENLSTVSYGADT
jgi:hypothetical protein